MAKEIVLNHIAIECNDQQSADIFFTSILGMQKIKSTTLTKKLSSAIFQIDSPVLFLTYEMGTSRIEVFIRKPKRQFIYNHVGIEVENKNEFIARCTSHVLEPFTIEKEGKQLLFVRDFSGNLFEVLEK
jgi:catechol 2,3-dioxygenase-like lactoylglutathione lyase family enzyme